VPRSAIHQENYEKICAGMNLVDVETLLGGPSRDESTGPLTADIDKDDQGDIKLFMWREAQFIGTKGMRDRRFPMTATWTSDSLVVVVEFDADGRVVETACLHVRRVRESPLELVRRWIGI
jgi:hypothetical protein